MYWFHVDLTWNWTSHCRCFSLSFMLASNCNRGDFKFNWIWPQIDFNLIRKSGAIVVTSSGMRWYAVCICTWCAMSYRSIMARGFEFVYDMSTTAQQTFATQVVSFSAASLQFAAMAPKARNWLVVFAMLQLLHRLWHCWAVNDWVQKWRPGGNISSTTRRTNSAGSTRGQPRRGV